MKAYSTVVEDPPQPTANTYPLLKVSPQGRIIWFISPKTGVMVGFTQSSNALTYACDRIGRYSECWEESGFVPFHGKVILNNA